MPLAAFHRDQQSSIWSLQERHLSNLAAEGHAQLRARRFVFLVAVLAQAALLRNQGKVA